MWIENWDNIITLESRPTANTDLIKQNKFEAWKKEYDLVDCNVLYITDSEEIWIKAGSEIIAFKIVNWEILERNNRW